MDSFYLNKIAGAILSSLLVIVGVRTFGTILYPKGDYNVSRGTITVTQNPVGAQAEAKPAAEKGADEPPINVLLASANVDAGQAAAKKCAACHVWDQSNRNNVGPGLHGVVGRPIAKHEGFQYSSALAGKGGNWDFEALNGFIKNPKGWAPGTKMAFAGVNDPKERANIIAFLNQQSDSPKPLPGK
jgi:cytochrome c